MKGLLGKVLMIMVSRVLYVERGDYQTGMRE